MNTSSTSIKELYTESEAAEVLGISIARLHQLLDRHVFNQGSARPVDIEFTSSDLLLLSYWAKRGERQVARGKLLQMRKRS